MSRRRAWSAGSFCRNTRCMTMLFFASPALFLRSPGSPRSSSRSRSSRSRRSCQVPPAAAGRNPRSRSLGCRRNSGHPRGSGAKRLPACRRDGHPASRSLDEKRGNGETVDDEHLAGLPALFGFFVLEDAADAFVHVVVADADACEGMQRCAADVACSDSSGGGDKNFVRAVLRTQLRYDQPQHITLSRSRIARKEHILEWLIERSKHIAIDGGIVNFELFF